MLVALACAAGGAHAGRPLSTEDASILDPGRCQLEAWIDRSRATTQAWLVPACNVGGAIEAQVGLGRTRADGRWRTDEAYVQGKGVLFAPEASPWSLGFVAGVTRRSREEKRGFRNPYVVVPMSYAEGPWAVHANAGWRRDALDRRDIATWGAALEREVLHDWFAVAEAFGEQRERPSWRGGVRYALLKDRMEIDLTWLTRPEASRRERFVSLGFTWTGAGLR